MGWDNYRSLIAWVCMTNYCGWHVVVVLGPYRCRLMRSVPNRVPSHVVGNRDITGGGGNPYMNYSLNSLKGGYIGII